MSTSFSLFRDKTFYKDFLFPVSDVDGDLLPKPLDFWYDRMLYGRVDERNDPVFISASDPESFKRFKQLDPEGNHLALNFVVDAFFSFRRNFDKAESLNRLSAESVIKNLTPDKGYVDVQGIYRVYMETVMNIFFNSYLSLPQHSEKIETFDDFVYKFVEFASSYAHMIPITMSSFIKSKYCTPLISGLVIEVAKVNHDDDKMREKWVRDPNYEFYVTTANKFGFVVDKNAPWRLIANITSKRMQNEFMNPVDPVNVKYPPNTPAKERRVMYPGIFNMKARFEEATKSYGANNPRSLFATYYEKSYLYDSEVLVSNLVYMYTKFYEKTPIFNVKTLQRCQETWSLEQIDKIVSKTIERQPPPSLKDAYNTSSQFSWSKIVFLIQMKEEDKEDINEFEFNKILNRANFIYMREPAIIISKGKINTISMSKGSEMSRNDNFMNADPIKIVFDNNLHMWYLKEAIKGFPKLQFKIQKKELEKRILSYRSQYSVNYSPNYDVGSVTADAIGTPGSGIGTPDIAGGTTLPSPGGGGMSGGGSGGY